ncbi:hypothetical protein [Alicyclobacillus ferrooxydans]|uniref:Uncharacterized protein n=1 Tax=Alicyclobacillus ferrooxydans TaxID=471514 RepID=A0A0P9CJ04_9BACL|nr:hypothetical protein [Alicyclobacillus ferrooxydans]KPV45624.1 hypothetical protein AN477_01530 [Alicyclobacillus ferrooxydans]
MLEVHSPVPLTEGESLIWGISTKHVTHFFIGLAVSSPLIGLAAVLLPVLHSPRWVSMFFGIGIGLMFAAVPYRNRPLAEFMWLRVRFSMRPKIVLFDRGYRILVHRNMGAQRNGRRK